MAKARVSPRPRQKKGTPTTPKAPLGHANIGTTTMYAHLSTTRRRQNLARLLERPGEEGRR